LEDMGWNLYRIWSTDWIKSQKSEEDKLVNAIEATLAGTSAEEPVESLLEQINTSEIAAIEIEEAVGDNNMSSVGYGFSEYESVKYWMFWDGDVSETIRKTIENQQPIHFEALCRILAPIWGNQKATNVIRREVNYYFRWHLNEIVKVDGDFVSLVGFDDLKVRVPKSSYDVRPIEYICEAELALALTTIASQSFGITQDDLITETARVYGFKRTGEKISSILRKVYNQLETDGKIKEIDGKVNVMQK
jgi:hypothetical protein